MTTPDNNSQAGENPHYKNRTPVEGMGVGIDLAAAQGAIGSVSPTNTTNQVSAEQQTSNEPTQAVLGATTDTPSSVVIATPSTTIPASEILAEQVISTQQNSRVEELVSGPAEQQTSNEPTQAVLGATTDVPAPVATSAPVASVTTTPASEILAEQVISTEQKSRVAELVNRPTENQTPSENIAAVLGATTDVPANATHSSGSAGGSHNDLSMSSDSAKRVLNAQGMSNPNYQNRVPVKGHGIGINLNGEIN